jgi:hypothetical protein
MADTAKRLAGPTSLTASSATIYTVPGSTTAILRNIRVANTTGVVARLTVSIGADAAGTRIWSSVAIPANDALDWSGFMVLAAAETLRAYSDTASALTITVSGVESA